MRKLRGVEAVYERRRDGIYFGGERRFDPHFHPTLWRRKLVSGTPWNLFLDDGSPEDSRETYELHLRLTNPAKGVDVIQLELYGERCRFRFHSLTDPILRRSGARLGLYEGDAPIAEYANAWRDVDVDAGISDRVWTKLGGAGADASALLLFILADHPLYIVPAISTVDVEEILKAKSNFLEIKLPEWLRTCLPFPRRLEPGPRLPLGF